jgi:hypothetical protein
VGEFHLAEFRPFVALLVVSRLLTVSFLTVRSARA